MRLPKSIDPVVIVASRMEVETEETSRETVTRPKYV